MSRALCVLVVLFVTSYAGAAWADDSTGTTEGGGEGSGEQTWPPPELRTRPPPIVIGELRSGGALGLGPIVGSRTGISIKLQPARPHAITLDIGATNFTNSVSFALGYAFSPRPLRGPNGISASFYIGAGARVRLLVVSLPDPDDPEESIVGVATVVGARVPLGLSFLMSGFPVELFVEAAPAIDFWQAFGIDIEGIGGARVFF